MNDFEKYYNIFTNVGYGQHIFVKDLEIFLEKQDNPEIYFGLIFDFRCNKKVKLIDKKKGFGTHFQIISNFDDPDKLYYLEGQEFLKKDVIRDQIEKEIL